MKSYYAVLALAAVAQAGCYPTTVGRSECDGIYRECYEWNGSIECYEIDSPLDRVKDFIDDSAREIQHADPDL